jgi:hypothetical protein
LLAGAIAELALVVKLSLLVLSCLQAAKQFRSVPSFSFSLSPRTHAIVDLAGRRDRHRAAGGMVPDKSEPLAFTCPSCEAEYKVVSVGAPSDVHHRKIGMYRLLAVQQPRECLASFCQTYNHRLRSRGARI